MAFDIYEREVEAWTRLAEAMQRGDYPERIAQLRQRAEELSDAACRHSEALARLWAKQCGE